MIKREELSNPNSCLSRARDDEMTFVLLGRDVAAPAAIRAWINERIRLGKNEDGDDQIVEAETCAASMEERRGKSVQDAAMALASSLERRGIRFVSVGHTVGNPERDCLIVYVEKLAMYDFSINEFWGYHIEVKQTGKICPS